MVEQRSGNRVYIGERILGLALLTENIGNQSIDFVHDFQERLVFGVLLCELMEPNETRVWATQNSMTITGNNFAGI